MASACVGGWHTVTHLLSEAPQRVLSVHLQADRDDARVRSLLALVELTGVSVERIARPRMDKLLPDTVHQGVIARIRPSAERSERELLDLVEAQADDLLLLILDCVQDPHNLGACLRTADGAGAHGVVAPRRRAAGLTDTVRKVASGAAETVPFYRVTNLARTLGALGESHVRRVGTSDSAPGTVYQSDLAGPLAVVMGGEARGLRRLTAENCDELVSLPMRGAMSSLNVSVATGIVLYEALRQRIAPAAGKQ